MGEPLRKLETGGVHNENGQLSGGYMIQEREMTVMVRVVSRCLGGEGEVKKAVVRGLVGAGARDSIQRAHVFCGTLGVLFR